jgi:hypothetical protein
MTSSVTSASPSVTATMSPHGLPSYGNGYAAAGAAMYAAAVAKDGYGGMGGFGGNSSLRLKHSPTGKDRDTPTGSSYI